MSSRPVSRVRSVLWLRATVGLTVTLAVPLAVAAASTREEALLTVAGRFFPRDRAPGDQGFRGVCELPDVSTSPMADRRASIELGEVDESAIGDIGLADVDDVSVRDPPRRQPLCCRGRSSVREPSGDAVLCVEGLGCTQARADHLGMGFSVLGVSYLSYNRPLVIATLNDWGWCSKGNPPPWYTGERTP
jgi:hypothetical protein